MKVTRSHRHSHAFTLVELLTVIAIVGILAAIVIPVVGKVRHNAHKAQSLNNLRQLGSAVMVFSSENRQTLPVYDPTNTTHYWLRELWELLYAGTPVPAMPPSPDNSDRLKETFGHSVFYTPLVEEGNQARAYGYNDRLTRYASNGVRTVPATPLLVNELLNPARTVVLGDATSINLTAVTAKDRNDGRVFCVFADGHVADLLPPDTAIPNPTFASERMPASNNGSTFWRGVETSPTGTRLTVW